MAPVLCSAIIHTILRLRFKLLNNDEIFFFKPIILFKNDYIFACDKINGLTFCNFDTIISKLIIILKKKTYN